MLPSYNSGHLRSSVESLRESEAEVPPAPQTSNDYFLPPITSATFHHIEAPAVESPFSNDRDKVESSQSKNGDFIDDQSPRVDIITKKLKS